MTTSDDFAGPPDPEGPPARVHRSLPEWSYPVSIYVLSALVIVSPFGTWLTLHFGTHQTVETARYHADSPFWAQLVLVVVALISTTASFVTRTRELRIVAATLLTALTIVTGTSIVQYGLFDAGLAPGSVTIGWGLWLSFISGLLGAVVAVAWLWASRTPADTDRTPDP